MPLLAHRAPAPGWTPGAPPAQVWYVPWPPDVGSSLLPITCSGSLALPHPTAGGTGTGGILALLWIPLAPGWKPSRTLPGLPGGTPFLAWTRYEVVPPVSTDTTTTGSLALPVPGMSGSVIQIHTSTGSVAIPLAGLTAGATGGILALLYVPLAPGWKPGTGLPGAPGGVPFEPWPPWRQVPPTPVTGGGSLALPHPTAGGTASAATFVTGSLALPHPTLSGTAKQVHTSTGSVALPHPAFSGTGSSGAIGITSTGSLALPRPALAVEAGLGGLVTASNSLANRVVVTDALAGTVGITNRVASPVTVTNAQAGSVAVSNSLASAVLVSNNAPAVTITSAQQ